jgi:hypothetical protein
MRFRQWPRAAAYLAPHGIFFDKDQRRTIVSELINGTEKGDLEPFRSTAAIVADCEILLNFEAQDYSFVLDEAFAVSAVTGRHRTVVKPGRLTPLLLTCRLALSLIYVSANASMMRSRATITSV